MRNFPAVFLSPLALDRSLQEPLHRQLYELVRRAIGDGDVYWDSRLRDSRLPSTRRLAKLLGVSRNTVTAAYDALAADDWIRGERGSCMRVNTNAVVRGFRSTGLGRVIRAARYPARTISFCDPDGNPIYLNF